MYPKRGPFTTRQIGEAVTAGGQRLALECTDGTLETVKEVFVRDVWNVEVPLTGEVVVSHGGYGRPTRYNVVQHKYAGGGHAGCGGHIEVLEIVSPPDDKHGILVYEYSEDATSIRTVFTEFDTLKHAISAWEKGWGSGDEERMEKVLASSPGFIRHVDCHGMTPWFYAIGRQVVRGDVVFPEGIDADPVYQTGRKFFVRRDDGYDSEGQSNESWLLKICWGAKRWERKSAADHFMGQSERVFDMVRVYWMDGTNTESEEGQMAGIARPSDGEPWIMEALEQFVRALNGSTREVNIHFTDGTRFRGRFTPAPKAPPWGTYQIGLRCRRVGTKEWGGYNNLFYFTPEKCGNAPTLAIALEAWAKKQGGEIEIISTKLIKRYRGKRWVGIYPPTKTR